MAMWDIEKAGDVDLKNEKTTSGQLAKLRDVGKVTGEGNQAGITSHAVPNRKILGSVINWIGGHTMTVVTTVVGGLILAALVSWLRI